LNSHTGIYKLQERFGLLCSANLVSDTSIFKEEINWARRRPSNIIIFYALRLLWLFCRLRAQESRLIQSMSVAILGEFYRPRCKTQSRFVINPFQVPRLLSSKVFVFLELTALFMYTASNYEVRLILIIMRRRFQITCFTFH